MRRTSLPIVEPCDEDWSAMTGDEQRRHCSTCAQEVLHLSAMTVEEARRALEASRGAKVCIRYAYDAEDRVQFAPARAAAPSPRTLVLASALSACTASAPAIDGSRPPVPALTEEGGWSEDQVDEEPLQCEREIDEPDSPEPSDMAITVVVTVPPRVSTTQSARIDYNVMMGVPVGRATEVMLPELVLAAPATIVTEQPSRRRLPLESRMGALALEVVEGEGDEQSRRR